MLVRSTEFLTTGIICIAHFIAILIVNGITIELSFPKAINQIKKGSWD